MKGMEEIYSSKLSNILYIMSIVTALWSGIEIVMQHRGSYFRYIWKFINIVGVLVGFYGILSYTVLNRVPSDSHMFVFVVQYNPEFYREMLMNVFLYFPFGLCLSTFISTWSILIGFLLSFCIEVWQFIAGTGLAQGTDVIMNTLGCTMGVFSLLVKKVCSSNSKA